MQCWVPAAEYGLAALQVLALSLAQGTAEVRNSSALACSLLLRSRLRMATLVVV